MKNKWMISMLMIALLPVTAAAQNSYMGKPGNSSSFGGKQDKTTITQANRPAETSHAPDYSTRADAWGIGVHMGIAQNNPKTLKDSYDEAFENGWTKAELTKNAGFFGLEALYEKALDDEGNKVGFKVGWDLYGENKLELNDEPVESLKATETTYSFPITLYYKRDKGIEELSWLAGVGLTIMHSEVEIKDTYYSEEYSKTKVFPHLTVGAEYRFSKLFALGLDLKYNIAAKIKKDGEVLSNRSGLGVSLTGRFYF